MSTSTISVSLQVASIDNEVLVSIDNEVLVLVSVDTWFSFLSIAVWRVLTALLDLWIVHESVGSFFESVGSFFDRARMGARLKDGC